MGRRFLKILGSNDNRESEADLYYLIMLLFKYPADKILIINHAKHIATSNSTCLHKTTKLDKDCLNIVRESDYCVNYLSYKLLEVAAILYSTVFIVH